MTVPFTIRPWAPTDTEELGEVFRRSVREVASRDYRQAQIEAWVLVPGEITAWAERMQNRTTFVAEESGRLIGFIQYEPPDHIDLIYVHPERQRMGVASALLAAYQSHRLLTLQERALLPAMLRAGALRFWISRLWDFHLPREAAVLKAHDPSHFERVLRQRVTYPITL